MGCLNTPPERTPCQMLDCGQLTTSSCELLHGLPQLLNQGHTIFGDPQSMTNSGGSNLRSCSSQSSPQAITKQASGKRAWPFLPKEDCTNCQSWLQNSLTGLEEMIRFAPCSDNSLCSILLPLFSFPGYYPHSQTFKDSVSQNLFFVFLILFSTILVIFTQLLLDIWVVFTLNYCEKRWYEHRCKIFVDMFSVLWTSLYF